jgi:hypothetical protein
MRDVLFKETAVAQDMTTAREGTPESLHTLAGYLERALDRATSLILIRHAPGVCTAYLGDPSGPREELRQIGTMTTALADDMLASTSSGANAMLIGEQPYRFVRSFTQIEDMAAVVFSV